VGMYSLPSFKKGKWASEGEKDERTYNYRIEYLSTAFEDVLRRRLERGQDGDRKERELGGDLIDVGTWWPV